LGERQELRVQASLLFGSVYGKDGRMFSMRAQLAF
jgi:hypothetical protein